MKIFYGIIGFLFVNYSLQGFQDTIKVEASELETFNLSKVATNSESIVLEIPAEMEDGSLFDLALNEDYIFALNFTSNNVVGNSTILQFQRNGKFIRQVGEKIKGLNSLFFDKKNEIIGINNGETISQYNFQGNLLRRIKAIEKDQIVHNEMHYGVEINNSALGEPVEYSLIQSDESGIKIKTLRKFKDYTDLGVGKVMHFSKQGSDLLLWNYIDHNFLLIEDDHIEVKYQLEIDKRYTVRGTTKIIEDWLIFSARNQRARQNIIKFTNLKSGESLFILDEFDAGIIDDLGNNGFIKLYQSRPIYGDVENKIFFLKDVSNIERIKSDYPSRFKVLIIATLK